MKSSDDPLVIKKLTRTDLPFCQYLVAEAGWNQTDSDWLRMLELSPEGCFKGEKGGVGVATTATCRFGDCAWIAMVLVDKRYRNQGIAREMLNHAMRYLKEQKVATIRLDATSLGLGLYKQLGFDEEYEIGRYERFPQAGIVSDHISPISDNELKDISDLDEKVSGVKRAALIQNLVRQGSVYATIEKSDLQLEGFACARPGINAIQVGPVAATNADSGARLLAVMCNRFAAQKIFADIPVDNQPAVAWALNNGFSLQRKFTRMYSGKKTDDLPDMIWAGFGPEKG